MTKPTKPTVPPAPSRANPGTVFSQTADTFAAFQATFADYLDATAEFVDERADAALAAALGGDLPSLTGNAGRFLRVNAGGTAAEFATLSGIGSETAQTITNLNTHNIGGTFYAASGATGLPVAEASVVVHQPADTNQRAAQEVVSLTSGQRWWRVETGGVWGAWQSQSISLATAVASASGTAVDFTGIPSWARRITIMFQSISTNGTSPPLIQLGTSVGFTSSGYSGSTADVVGASAALASTGFQISTGFSAAAFLSGSIVIENITGNSWVARGTFARADTAQVYVTAGSVALAAALDRVRIATISGVNTFDNGTLNISWE